MTKISMLEQNELKKFFCCSSYLTFRYIISSDAEWYPGIKSPIPPFKKPTLKVTNPTDTLYSLKQIMIPFHEKPEKTGILLSGGIDSAILAALMPKGSKSYTIRFIAQGAIDESKDAAVYADLNKLSHQTIEVSFEDYLKTMDKLMLTKKSPLHPVECALYKAALKASQDGVSILIVGNGADSTFGGLDKLLSKEWTVDSFIRRYTFVPPEKVLNNAISMYKYFKPYDVNGHFDTVRFLKEIHGAGIIQAFNNAITAGGCIQINPYEELYLDTTLDLEKIRHGESKYILRQIFKRLYPSLNIKKKIAFARPMDKWMFNWQGPRRNEFIPNLNISNFNGEQRWLIYCLERFLNILDKEYLK